MKSRIEVSRWIGNVVAACAMLVLAVAIAPEAAAANHTVAANTGKVDCRSFDGGVRPGDTIVLAGKARGPVTFSDCIGTAANPITIRNDVSENGPLVISYGGNGFQSRCENCEHVVMDGTGKWNGAPAGECGASLDEGQWVLGKSQCGIVMKCTNGSPHSALRISGSSKFMTIKGIEIDGNMPTCSGLGLSINDHQYHPRAGEWREGFAITNNYIHRTSGTGMYFGPNQAHSAVDDMPLRDNEIAHNHLDGTGCDGIKYKSAIAGSSEIHHNYVVNAGQKVHGDPNAGCGANGISLFEAGFTKVYSNFVEAPNPNSDGRGNCIVQSTLNMSSSVVATLPVEIYNNVVRNCGGKGIASTRSKKSNPQLKPTIYNNTIVAPVASGGISINGNVGSCSVRDNILAGVNLSAKQCSMEGNVVATVASLKFVNASGDDYRLTDASPAVDAAAQCPHEDQAGNRRPQGNGCDQGALEYTAKQAQGPSSKPSPPSALNVE